MSRIAYVNGRYLPHAEAAVHIDDRGFQFADGVYEVFAVHGGQLIGEQGHMDRLGHSLKELRIEWPMAPGPMMIVAREVMRRNHVRDGMIYLQISRGVARRDHPFPDDAVSSLVITAKKMPPLDKGAISKGVAVITVPETRWKHRDIKSTSLLPNVLAKQDAREAGAYEAWFVDEDGLITEGSSTNAWIVTKDGELVTRDVSRSILNGITRLAILEAAAESGLEFTERAFSVDEAENAREAFISSSTSHVKAVTNVNGRSIGNGHVGDMTSRLLDAYVSYVETVGGPRKTDRWN